MHIPLTIAEAAAALGPGSVTPLELVAECLERIERYEPAASAWVLVDAEGALREAERLTHASHDGRGRGPLYGIPLGIKDIVDVAGMPTRAGSTLTADTLAAADAPVVARLRAAGAVILGKTVTTEFACFDPPRTKNPWNAACTPGGSSSGSAAAVALGMCIGAIGSQTGGSITRPASYCGVAGVKPTFGRVSRAGVVPVAHHLDHVGPIARTAADCAILLRAISGYDAGDPASSPRADDDWPEDLKTAPPPRLGVVRPYFFETAEVETAELTERALRAIAAAGATVVELPLPEHFGVVHAMHRRIMTCEGAEYHRLRFGAPRAGYRAKMAAFIDEGLAVTAEAYQEALRHQAAFRDALERTLADVDALAIPSTPAPAPLDLTTTGDPRFNSPWSHAGVPTVSIPCALTKSGLPISLQLIGRAWSEPRLLAVAMWCEGKLGFDAVPPTA